MHVPTRFSPTEAATEELLEHHGAADLVTVTAEGLNATLVPFVYDRERRTMQGHLARSNPQWSREPLGEVLIVVRVPEAYVTPSWYASRSEHGRVVPTWNYVTAHVYGTLRVFEDPGWIRASLRRLTEKHETGRTNPWTMDEAPASYIERHVRGVVGIEVEISRVDAKFKLSQDRTPADVDGVIEGLRRSGDDRMADAVARHRSEPADPLR